MKRLLDLETALVDLLYATRGGNLRLIVGGGYGIHLKRKHVRTHSIRTLLAEWPEARSTNDLDLFLRPEFLAESARLRPLADALTELGYHAAPGAEKYQFVKPGPGGGRTGSIKIDLLTGPRSRFEGTSAKVDDRRVRPQPSLDLHAHPVDEAVTLEEGLLATTIRGATSGGVQYEAEVHVPHPMTTVLMKLFAFRDRFGDPDKDSGRYHALDLYAALALATEPEWNGAIELSQRHRDTPTFSEARSIVDGYFSSLTSPGMLRLRESPYCRPELQLADFLSALQELFPSPTAR
jgi:hypothetical protein